MQAIVRTVVPATPRMGTMCLAHPAANTISCQTTLARHLRRHHHRQTNNSSGVIVKQQQAQAQDSAPTAIPTSVIRFWPMCTF
jgi:hypothetical protein